ncbi:cobyrinate a,c-diamide synthase [Novosphingobium sp. 9U]|uniref:cobyrinate a,c-diamide synthase n=1 Tax=Novosphingobium sp. 9U TaxID=2653158 RepID=UPI0013571440|nr:cobyrinate a,c-diamide synthase [Novosphingobium sp. 9U]
MISAPASGQGKTTVTAALARLHRDAGRRVRVFKCGPDFLDPMILEQASGAPVYQLDLFMVGEAECRRLLHEAAVEADLILVEGVMGLFDGEPSAADLAIRFGLPVLAIIDASAMAQTFGALVQGLATYRPELNVAAVLANRVGSAGHAAMLEGSLAPGVQWLGALTREPDVALPERHLGLVQASEIGDIDARITKAAAALSPDASWTPPPVRFDPPDPTELLPQLLQGTRIAIARDEAFGFIYPANLACLRSMGGQPRFFSPLRDVALPDCDAVWLPGGYPELHLAALSANRQMIASIQAHHHAGKPILAECGGLLYILDELDDGRGQRAALAGLLPGTATMQPRLAALGLQQATLPSGTLRGHTFHYSKLETTLAGTWQAERPDGRLGEAIFRRGGLTATYMHFYFPSAPRAVAQIFGR